jgi:hypothetical protein
VYPQAGLPNIEPGHHAPGEHALDFRRALKMAKILD